MDLQFCLIFLSVTASFQQHSHGATAQHMSHPDPYRTQSVDVYRNGASYLHQSPHPQRGINYMDRNAYEQYQHIPEYPTAPPSGFLMNATVDSALVGPACQPDYDPDNQNNGTCVAGSAIRLCSDMKVSASKDCRAFNYGNAVCCYMKGDPPLAGPPGPPGPAGPPGPSSSVYENAQLAQVVELQCGVPNLTPNIFVPDAPRRAVRALRPRIVGGSDAPNGSASICWQIAIAVFSRSTVNHICGGSIVGARTIITTADCLVTASRYAGSNAFIQVIIGVKARNWAGSPLYPSKVEGCARGFNVSNAVPHPEFNPKTYDNNIGILVLSEPIDFRKHGNCACKVCLNEFTPPVGDKCFASGFGAELADPDDILSMPRFVIPLKYVKQTILDPVTRCSWLKAPEQQGETVQLNKTNIDLILCAGGIPGESFCVDDKGGPLFCYDAKSDSHYLAGVASFGRYPCADSRGSIFTRVDKYLQWIFNSAAPLGDVTVMQPLY